MILSVIGMSVIVLITLTGLRRPSLKMGSVIPCTWILQCIEKEEMF